MKFISTNENIQQARKVLKERNSLPGYDEIIDEDHDTFKELKKIVGENTGYLGMFTRLFYLKKYRVSELENLFQFLKDNKRFLKDLPKEIISYTNIEEIYDDFLKVKEWAIYKKEFVSRLSSSLKENAKKDEDLKNTIIYLTDEEKEDVYKNFLPKTARYRDYKEFRTDILNFIHNNVNIDDLIKSIEETKGAYIEYNKDRVVVASIFIRTASCKIGSSSWCISGNSGAYWNQYAGLETGNKQYFIWNLNLAPSNVNSKIGVTVKPNGSVHTVHAKDDSFVHNFNDMIDKLDIRDILLPMDIERDYKKLMESYNFSPKVVGLVAKHDKQLLLEFRGQINNKWLMIYGLLSEEEIGDNNEITYIQKYIYSDQKSEKINQLINWCNKLGKEYTTVELNEEKNSESLEILNKLDFKDKLFLLNKYHSDDINFTDGGINVFFNKEILEPESTFVVSVNYHSNILFSFEMDEGEFSSDILNIDDDAYNGLQSLSGYYTITDDEEEQNYMNYHFNDRTMKSLVNYVKYLKPFQSNLLLMDDLRKVELAFSDNFRNALEFEDCINILFAVDKKFNDYITDFRYELAESAEVKVTEDINTYENHLMGIYDGSKWEISLEDIIDNFPLENILEPMSFTDWINSYPNDISEVSFIFIENGSDYPHASSYFGAADSTKANELLQGILENIVNDKENEEYYEDRKKIEETILSRGFGPDTKSSYHESWYGYVKKQSNTNIQYIIPMNSIDVDEETAIVFILDKDINKYKGSYKSKLDYLDLTVRNIDSNREWMSSASAKSKDNNLIADIKYQTIDLSNDSFNPNQLNLDLKESIKSYNSFKQSKLG